jgi:DNA-binding transcriptional LysR family regulator
MLDGITLDQLRTFVTVVDEGSFSAAGRKLRRVQSAVSHAMANLEGLLGLKLWDRRRKTPTLTAEGSAVLVAARRLCREVDDLRQVAEGLAGGLEGSVALAVDALLPVALVVDACQQFRRRFPTVQLRLFTDTMSAVSSLVAGGTCDLGIVGPAADATGLEREHLMVVRLIPVVARRHPLASHRGPIPLRVLADHVNIVFSERSPSSRDQGVLSPNTWRIADLSVKHALLLGGLGWGNLPEHLIAADLRARRLVRIRPAAWSADEWQLSFGLVHRADRAQGPAVRWLHELLRSLGKRFD